MAYTAWNVVFGEQPTAAKWNQLGENDAGFKDGSNIDDDAIIQRHIADSAVGAAQRKEVTKVGFFNVVGNGSLAITGVGFRPKSVIFFAAIAGGAASASSRGMAMGAMDDSSQGGFHQSDREAHGSSSEFYNNKVIEIATIASGGGGYSADPTLVKSSLDSDGFTLTVSNFSTGRTVMYLAIA